MTRLHRCAACYATFRLWNLAVALGMDSGRVYWLLTELFCELHHGRDWCDGKGSR